MKLDQFVKLFSRSDFLGFKVLNVFYYDKKLYVQLIRDKKIRTLSVKLEVPVFRYRLDQLNKEKNISKILYFIEKHKCEKIYVDVSNLYKIGKMDVYDDYIFKNFNMSEYLVYNVMRPEYYITTNRNIPRATIEDVSLCSLDIEVSSDAGDFASPLTAKYPVNVATIFDFDAQKAYVFILDDGKVYVKYSDIMKKIKEHFKETNYRHIAENLNIEFIYCSKETDFLNLLFEKLKHYSIVTGWNVVEYDIRYLLKRCEICNVDIKFFESKLNGEIYYYFFDFVVIDYLSLYKWIIEKNPPSMKLSSICENVLKVSKMETESFLDIAYNIIDCMLIYLLEENLNLISVLFEFIKNGALLHLFNVSNILEPYLYKLIEKNFKSTFICSRYTILYNTYFNNIYKIVNKQFYESVHHFYETLDLKSLEYYIKNYRDFKDYIKKCLIREADSATESGGFHIQTLLNQMKKEKVTDAQIEKFKSRVSEFKSDEILSIKDFIYKYFGLKIDNISTYLGAFNKAFVGFERGLIDLDFFSMYPTIIYTLNISLETLRWYVPIWESFHWCYHREEYLTWDKEELITIYDFVKDRTYTIDRKTLIEKIFMNDQYIISNLGVVYLKKLGFIPKLIEYVLRIRGEYKKKMEEETNPVLRKKYYALQLFYKIYANSIYGYFGYLNGVLFNLFMVSTVTNMGRFEILYANYKVTKYLKSKMAEEKQKHE